METDSSILAGSLLLPLFCSACGPDDLPTGPCNDDSATTGLVDEDPGLILSTPLEFASATRTLPTANGELHPPIPELRGWIKTSGLNGLYREATERELRRFGWPEHTLVLAAPVGILEEGPETASVRLPRWQADQADWARDEQGRVFFERQELLEVQKFALGHFVEHRRLDGSPDAKPVVRRPTFKLYGAKGPREESLTQLLADSSGAISLRHQTPQGKVQLSAPLKARRLDISAPLDFQLAVVSPSKQDITRDPLTPYNCENGECEDPDDPLDECSDSLDNDGDGFWDLCDWNCLPHSDFGAHNFPEAYSRIEHGKNYALMGGGGLCTLLGESWMVTFADWSLQASEFLNDVRETENDPVHYRVFSCWIFENRQEMLECQHGYVFDNNGMPIGTGPANCPVGMEDYPYQPSENDPDPGLLLFYEAIQRAWSDLALNTLALGPDGEPVNGVAFLTDESSHTCEGQNCQPVAGRAEISPYSDVWNSGSLVVSDDNDYDWHTLAHETAHTLGMLHDDAPDGFMTGPEGHAPTLGTSVDPGAPGKDNNVTWATAFSSKHSHPRSAGWYWTGCFEVEDVCAPLGKPGWSCEQAWCEPD